jgi:5'-deoxynucleotidase YfbR-like HD superfamily hydrolase
MGRVGTLSGTRTYMQEIITFILEVDKLKNVSRKVRPVGLDRYENSAEHSWQLGLFATSLAPYAEPDTDINHVIRMLLIHDIGEIDTGDMFVFVQGGWDQRKAAELLAVKRIFGLLPRDQAVVFLELWEEFELSHTPEARFANAVDRAMPVLLNLANHGGSWLENGVSYERVVGRVGPQIQEGCPALWDYIEQQLGDAHKNGWFGIPVS